MLSAQALGDATDFRLRDAAQRAKANALLADRRRGGPLRKGEQRPRPGQHPDSEPDTTEDEDAGGGGDGGDAERWLRPTLRPNRTLSVRAAMYDSGSDTEISLAPSARCGSPGKTSAVLHPTPHRM